jgi:predicted RNA binding protein YcfA (HicA-like mRNA interferase family)
MPKKYGDVRRRLRSAGWSRVRQRGSHELWRSPDGEMQVTVSGRDSKTIPAGTLAEIRRRTRMDDLR